MVFITTIADSFSSEIARIDCTEIIFVTLNTREKSCLISDNHTVFKLRACLILDAIWINKPLTDDRI